MENSIKAILIPCADSVQPFLTDLIPDDSVKGKKRDNWDTRKNYSVQVKDIFTTGQPRHQRQAERINQCAETLFFDWSKIDANGEIKLQFKKAYFCRVRNCPICQWRRSQMWLARFFVALPRIYAVYPTVRYVLLTLTVENCLITELRTTVQNMNKAWKRLSERKAFPALGFVRSLEVTKEKARPDYCHPHFHVILALPASYFGGNYLSTAKWSELWKESLRIDYTPICDVRLVKAKPESNSAVTGHLEALQSAILETVKYTVKPSDMVIDRDWTLTLVDQLHKMRAVALGGIFKEFLSEQEQDEEDNKQENGEQDDSNGLNGLYFGWRQAIRRYQLKTR